MRSEDRKYKALEGKFDVAAFQETCTDVKDMYDVNAALACRKFRAQ